LIPSAFVEGWAATASLSGIRRFDSQLTEIEELREDKSIRDKEI